MLNLRRAGLFSMPLRAAFAIVFLLFSMAQPAIFAVSGSDGVAHGLAVKMTGAAPAAHDAHDHDHVSGHVHAGNQADDGSFPQEHGANTAGKNCEVHCAPAQAMPVACAEIASSFVGCFAPTASDSLEEGEYTDHNRPPRRLI